MNIAWKIALLVIVAASAIWWASSKVGRCATEEPPVNLPKLGPARRLPLPKNDVQYHGISWQIHYSYDCVNRARKMIGQIADLGADTILISNAGTQEHAGSETFQIDPKITPTPDEWQQIFKIAHDNGLRVILMPIILLSEPRGNEWRGVINPPSWDEWFKQYQEFLLHFARIAAKGKVEVMTVGSELISTEKYTDNWRKIIREIRKVYPGKISYSGNWDHYKHVEFWDELDLIGMTSYYKLSPKPNPGLESLIEAWKPIKRGILRWQKNIGKPLLFTEVGWCSQEGASVEPWNYYYKQTATKAGHEEQRRNYRAFIETWKETPQVGGIIWWEWNDTNGGIEDYNYTPKGKPAEAELQLWFSKIRQKRLPATTRPATTLPAASNSG